MSDEKESFDEKKERYLKQLIPFKSRLDEWSKLHPNEPPPLHVDDNGEVHWVNRKLRRKFGKR